MTKRIGTLCVITDTSVQQRFSHIELAELALKGGADMIQLRAKNATTAELLEYALAIRKLCRKYKGTLIINDRVDIALAADSDGVHLGAEDLPIAVARKLLGPKKIIGATAPTIQAAIQAEQNGADYIGFGHIFPTSTKHKPEPPKGIRAISGVRLKIGIPLMAIGGIDHKNAASIAVSGADSLAVVSAICASPDPLETTRQMKAIISEHPYPFPYKS
ncbi:MAG: thiamine phosphate synthase [Chlorobiales bacterium]|nr:thiamine phosphate synthase [Chlorobiales bacterium]